MGEGGAVRGIGSAVHMSGDGRWIGDGGEMVRGRQGDGEGAWVGRQAKRALFVTFDVGIGKGSL